jgi:hypothetical protein
MGEHLIVMLVVAVIVITTVVVIPSLMAQTQHTAAQLEERVNVHHTALAELESAP